MGDFVPTHSTDHIWREEDMEQCLSTDLNTIESNIAALQSGKANASHAHTEYASASDVSALQTLVGDTSVASQISSAIATKADVNHTHSGYAAAEHTHTGYAAVDHTHSGYASSEHTHNYNDLTDKPTIPTSLPANGGNADTVDGKHANEFAIASDVTALQTLVGDSSVSSQITSALQNAGYATQTYVNTQVSALVDSAPGTLDTLNELAAALGDDPNFATTIATQIGNKANSNHTHDNIYYTETEIDTLLNSKANTNHTHTASDIGALPLIDARSANYDMDTILQSGVHHNIYNTNSSTLGTPYAKGVSSFGGGLIISEASSTNTGKQIAYINGSSCTFERRMHNGVIGDWQTIYNSGFKPSLSDLGAAPASHTHNVFSSLTQIGITTFPTTMKIVSESMPANSMIIIDNRRLCGVDTGYNTETISDWGNTANGTAIIVKGVSTARIGMMLLYGTTATASANLHYGSYAHDADNVNWVNIDDRYVNKIKTFSAVDLNTLTTSGLYYVSSETAALHCPVGTNGHMLVISDGTRVRQVFFRVGTVDTNSFQWYSRHLGSDLTVGDNGWSQWWLLSGCELAWSGTAALNAEINLGSRYGCQAWVVTGQVTNTGTYSTVYIPRYFLTTNTTKYKLQIADETGYVSFYFYYKTSDDNVYAKVVWVSDTNNSALKYVYRVS